MPSPARAAQLQPNLMQSLELVLGDHIPLKTVVLFTSSSLSRAPTGSRLCRAPSRRASVSGSIARAQPPWRAAARPTPSTHRRRTNLDDDKAGTTTAARNHRSTPCAPVQAATECDFASTRGKSRQFLPHGWIGDRRWYPLPTIQTIHLQAGRFHPRHRRASRPDWRQHVASRFQPQSSPSFIGKYSNMASRHSN